MTIANAVITDNYAGNDGGGVQFYDSNGNVTISNTEISNNTAYYGGGGLYADGADSLDITITGSTITGNIAGYGSGEKYSGGNGGGLYVTDANLTVTTARSTSTRPTSTTATKATAAASGSTAPLTMSGSFVGYNVADRTAAASSATAPTRRSSTPRSPGTRPPMPTRVTAVAGRQVLRRWHRLARSPCATRPCPRTRRSTTAVGSTST